MLPEKFKKMCRLTVKPEAKWQILKNPYVLVEPYSLCPTIYREIRLRKLELKAKPISHYLSFPLVSQANKYSTASCYLMNIASPKEKKRYFSFIATLYAFKIISLLDKAETSIIKVLCGRWKLVTRASTNRNV